MANVDFYGKCIERAECEKYAPNSDTHNRDAVLKALERSSGVISKAAKVLGVSLRTAFRLVKTHGLRKEIDERWGRRHGAPRNGEIPPKGRTLRFIRDHASMDIQYGELSTAVYGYDSRDSRLKIYNIMARLSAEGFLERVGDQRWKLTEKGKEYANMQT